MEGFGRLGMARLGVAWRVSVRQVRYGMVRCVLVWSGMAGMARLGRSRNGRIEFKEVVIFKSTKKDPVERY